MYMLLIRNAVAHSGDRLTPDSGCAYRDTPPSMKPLPKARFLEHGLPSLVFQAATKHDQRAGPFFIHEILSD